MFIRPSVSPPLNIRVQLLKVANQIMMLKTWFINTVKIKGESNVYATQHSMVKFVIHFHSSAARVELVDEIHVCKKSLDLEIEVKRLSEKLDRMKEMFTAKASQIKKLDSLVAYYQKRAKTLTDIISNMKAQEFISDEAEQVLNVRQYD